MGKIGICLINLGTPDSPEPREVGVYLREFLMDPLVVDIAWPLRWFLVNVLIVPRRAHASSELYKKVWTTKGSPLLQNTLELAREVRAQWGDDFVVVPAMRYGTPSLRTAFETFKKANVSKIIACPLYPQYSLAATESSLQKLKSVVDDVAPEVPLEIVPPFYNHPEYIDAVANVSAPYLARPHDLVIFSFHGLPERQVRKTDPTAQHCLRSEDCCAFVTEANKNCYRAQCYATAKALAERLGISRYEVAFQSRLGRTPWIRPYTDQLYRELPEKGVKRLVVLSPSFVADCLETLEEIAIRGKEEFLRHGGTELTMVPSLNASPIWAEKLRRILKLPTEHVGKH